MRLGGGESCCGDFSRSEFCLNEFFCSKIGFVGASARSACGASVRLGGENLVVGEVPVLSFALKKFSVLRLALLGQACALVGKSFVVGIFLVLSFA